jgi:hypothetical protein
VIVGEDHRGRPVPQLELGEQVVDVGLDRAFADEKLGGDLAVGPAAADAREHVKLTAGQRA